MGRSLAKDKICGGDPLLETQTERDADKYKKRVLR